MNETLAPQCGLATNYHDVGHPSLPNYIAATSGLSLDELGSMRAGCDPSAACSTDAPNLFAQTPSWRVYEESMHESCAPRPSGQYVPSRNPAVYYSRSLVGCDTNDVDLRELKHDLADDRLPAFAFVVPKM